MRLILLIIIALVAPALPTQAQESIVTGISTDNIALTADFEGSEVFVFGAIRREAPVPEEAGQLDIILTLRGPEQPLWVRRKERRFGIWVNTEGVRISQAPSYYAVASTRPVKEILSETERLRWGIGMDQAVRLVGGHPTITDTRPFADALVRIKESQRLYAQLEGEVRLVEDTLFQTTFELPANLVEGTYTAEFFLVRDRKVLHSGGTEILVQKAGLERWIYNLSQELPLVYGLAAVALALCTGWLAAVIARLLRR